MRAYLMQKFPAIAIVMPQLFCAFSAWGFIEMKAWRFFFSFLLYYLQALQWTGTEGLQATCAAALELSNPNYVQGLN